MRVVAFPRDADFGLALATVAFRLGAAFLVFFAFATVGLLPALDVESVAAVDFGFVALPSLFEPLLPRFETSPCELIGTTKILEVLDAR